MIERKCDSESTTISGQSGTLSDGNEGVLQFL